ncbi:MAG: YkgJ family cysteine cluster protein [Thermodesulfobacteriota bacterium]
MPASREEAESQWPRLLTAIMAEIRSPADPAGLADRLRRDELFTALLQSWDKMPFPAQARAWEMIQSRLREEAIKSRPFCIRCGECCRRGSPPLLPQDLPALAEGHIARSDLMTLRRGEPAYSNWEEKKVLLPVEQVKLREVPGGRTCLFLGPGDDACLIYPNRPHQCRIMDCWDPSRFERLRNLPVLTRGDLIGRDHQLGRLIEHHEERCGLPDLAQRLTQAAAGDGIAADEALDAVLFDLHVREFAAEKFSLPWTEMIFFFGRPLTVVIKGLGYAFDPGEGEGPKLSRIEGPPPPGDRGPAGT